MKTNIDLIVNASLSIAITNIQHSIKECGYLCHKDSKQSEKNKEYFEGVRQEYLYAIEILKGFKR